MSIQEEMKLLWEMVRNHSGVCTCSNCVRWDELVAEITAQAEEEVEL